MGGLIADVKNDFIRTVFLIADAGAVEPYARLRRARSRSGALACAPSRALTGPAIVQRSADMRYLGSPSRSRCPLEKAWIEDGDIAAIAAAFHRRHAALYDFDDEAAQVQIVNLRLVIAGETPPSDPGRGASGSRPRRPERELIEVWLDGAPAKRRFIRASALAHGHRFAGPAMVAQEDTTLCVPPAFDGDGRRAVSTCISTGRSA